MSVYKNAVAKYSTHLVHWTCHIDQFVGRIECAILNHQRHIELPAGEFRCGFFFVRNEEQTRESRICLKARTLMRVRMKPVRSCSILYLQVVYIRFSRTDRVTRMPIHFRWNVET